MDAILSDIFDNHRGFLPGGPAMPDDVRRQMHRSIRFDGLADEEALLILSTLPSNASYAWVSPMDKGLSGSRVLRVRYSTEEGRFSKPFVVKIGDVQKIGREAEAVERLCSPYLPGIEFPVRRRGLGLGLIAQELRGLSAHADVESLRNWIRMKPDGDTVVRRLLRERLAPWYEPADDPALEVVKLDSLLRPYLEKRAGSPESPVQWDDLHTWVEEVSGIPQRDPGPAVAALSDAAVHVPVTIAHGDLHSQNVVVDTISGEAWPIDFAWCTAQSSLVVDLVMLECSLKYLAFPMRADLRELLRIDWQLCNEYQNVTVPARMPYANEVRNVLNGIFEVRRYAESVGISFDDYRRCLSLMTYAHTTHTGLNRPLVLGGTQMLLGLAA